MVTCLALIGLALGTRVVWAEGESSSALRSIGGASVVGITEPFRVATLAGVQPARIAAIPFPEGAYVSEGEVVAAMEDGIQRARTELARAAMETSLPVDLERARLGKARRDRDWFERLKGDDFASSREYGDAVSTFEIAQVEYDHAVFNQEQAVRGYEREKAALAEYRIRAPFPAYVAAHLKHPGESVDQLEGVVRLVQLDPLLVVADCPLALAGSAVVGNRYLVRPADSRWNERSGTVIFASRAADAASQTFRVKLKVENQDHDWMAGLKVVVDFSTEQIGMGTSSDTEREADESGEATDQGRVGVAKKP